MCDGVSLCVCTLLSLCVCVCVCQAQLTFDQFMQNVYRGRPQFIEKFEAVVAKCASAFAYLMGQLRQPRSSDVITQSQFFQFMHSAGDHSVSDATLREWYHLFDAGDDVIEFRSFVMTCGTAFNAPPCENALVSSAI